MGTGRWAEVGTGGYLECWRPKGSCGFRLCYAGGVQAIGKSKKKKINSYNHSFRKLWNAQNHYNVDHSGLIK